MINRRKVVVTCRKPEDTHVKQSFKHSTDIHTILERVQMGDHALFDASKGAFVELFDAPEDLSEAYRRVDQINALFMDLPSKLRTRFDHDVRSFAEWLDTHHTEQDIRDLIQSVYGDVDSPQSAEKKQQSRPVDRDDFGFVDRNEKINNTEYREANP